jgi:diguanylate cyclase (GGDEF)-like protein
LAEKVPKRTNCWHRLKLRQKMLIITALGMTVLVGLISYFAILHYNDLSEARLREDSDSAADLVVRVLDSIKNNAMLTAADYGTWTECYSAVQKHDAKWAKSNFEGGWVEATYSDLMALEDLQGDRVYAHGDLVKDPDFEIPDGMLIRAKRGKASTTIMQYGEHLMLGAVVPVVRSDGSGNPIGVVALFRPVDNKMLGELSRISGKQIALCIGDKLVAKSEKAEETWTTSKAVADTRLPEFRTQGGAYVAALPANDSRPGDLYARFLVHSGYEGIGEPTAMATYRTVIASIIVVPLFAMLVTLLAIGMIAKPLGRLKEGVSKWTAGDYSYRLPEISRQDEIGMIHAGMNDLAQSLECAFTELEAQMEETSAQNEQLQSLYTILEGRTAQLTDANRKLELLAQTDALTGLHNRRSLWNQMDVLVERIGASGKPMGFIMIDADLFKAYNDKYGHQAGDQLLVRLAWIIRDEARAGDIACRYGGEEFAVVLPGANLQAANILAERLRIKVHDSADPYQSITISLGVAEWGPEMTSPADLIGAADQALYRAKEAGRNCVRVAVGPDEAAA